MQIQILGERSIKEKGKKKTFYGVLRYKKAIFCIFMYNPTLMRLVLMQQVVSEWG